MHRVAHLLLVIFLANTTLDRRTGGNAIEPLEQVGERLDVFGSKSRAFPALDPGPSLDVRNAVFTLAVASQVVPGFAACVDT